MSIPGKLREIFTGKRIDGKFYLCNDVEETSVL